MAPAAIFTSSFFLSLLERSVDFLAVVEPDGTCLYLNEGGSACLGTWQEEAGEENMAEWVHPQDRQVMKRVLEQASRQSGAPCPAFRLLQTDGNCCWLSGEVVNMLQHPETPGLVLLLKKIPAPKTFLPGGPHPDEKLQQFSYIVSHHLRAPLANALGLVNLLTDPKPTEDLYQEILKNLKFSVCQLDAVTKDINLILSCHSPADMQAREKVSFEQVFGQVMQNLSLPLQDCQGEIVLDVPGGYTLLASRAYVYSILYNLVSNAIQYRSSQRPLQISLQCRGSRESGTYITCEDNGVGMERNATAGNLFRPCRKFPLGTPGRGIGLYLVKTHVESLGGKIEVFSSPEKGSRFLIHLPA